MVLKQVEETAIRVLRDTLRHYVVHAMEEQDRIEMATIESFEGDLGTVDVLALRNELYTVKRILGKLEYGIYKRGAYRPIRNMSIKMPAIAVNNGWGLRFKDRYLNLDAKREIESYVNRTLRKCDEILENGEHIGRYSCGIE
jgi:hypothetical protein